MASIPTAEESARKILRIFVEANQQANDFLTGRFVQNKFDGHFNDYIKGLEYAIEHAWLKKGESDNIFLTERGFSEAPEKEELVQAPPFHVSNFITGVHNSQIQLQTTHSSQVINQLDLSSLKRFADELLGKIDELGIDAETENELNAEIKTIIAQTESPHPKQSILKESLFSVRRILEGAGGSLAAQLLIQLAKMIV